MSAYHLTYFCFFFLMTPPPPRSTLFPYTTLFRSDPRLGRARLSARWRTRTPPSRAANIVQPDQSDRKSTRLNSSHTVISYAVFCLKKKKKINRHDQMNKLYSYYTKTIPVTMHDGK